MQGQREWQARRNVANAQVMARIEAWKALVVQPRTKVAICASAAEIRAVKRQYLGGRRTCVTTVRAKTGAGMRHKRKCEQHADKRLSHV